MLCVKNITKSFDTLKVLDQISFTVKEKEIVAIVGPSGCGKSTLLKMIAGLQDSDEGMITGADQQISYIFQEDRLLPWRTVWENINLAGDKENKQEIQKLIDEVGLNGFEKYYPGQLSGGMKKRCGIARAFYHKNNLLLMDEPFSGLDYGLRHEMLALLRSVWMQRQQSILFITHDPEEALAVADRILIFTGRPSRIKKEIILPDFEERSKRKNKECIRMQILDAMLEENDNEFIKKFAV